MTSSKLMVWLKRYDLLSKLFPYNGLSNSYVNSFVKSPILPSTYDGQDTILSLKETDLQRCGDIVSKNIHTKGRKDELCNRIKTRKKTSDVFIISYDVADEMFS